LASQLVRFASIGVVSTVVFAVLFALTAPRLGSMLAAVVALGVCTVANTAANRRLTFSLRGRASLARHHLGALGLAVLPLAGIVVTLLALGAAGVTSMFDQLIALTLVNATASTLRFIVLRRWVFRRPRAESGAFSRRFRQLVRYGSVSLIATTTSLIVLGTLVATSAMPAVWANVVATAVGTIPSFELNRRWVWAKTGKRSLGGEVIPFVVLSFAGLGLSTLAVGLTALWADSLGLEATARTVAVELANLAAFGTLWIAQFVILDRVLFRHRAAEIDVADGRLGDLDDDLLRPPTFVGARDGVAA
jgi:putative flippase GtrA